MTFSIHPPSLDLWCPICKTRTFTIQLHSSHLPIRTSWKNYFYLPCLRIWKICEPDSFFFFLKDWLYIFRSVKICRVFRALKNGDKVISKFLWVWCIQSCLLFATPHDSYPLALKCWPTSHWALVHQGREVRYQTGWRDCPVLKRPDRSASYHTIISTPRPQVLHLICSLLSSPLSIYLPWDFRKGLSFSTGC